MRNKRIYMSATLFPRFLKSFHLMLALVTFPEGKKRFFGLYRSGPQARFGLSLQKNHKCEFQNFNNLKIYCLSPYISIFKRNKCFNNYSLIMSLKYSWLEGLLAIKLIFRSRDSLWDSIQDFDRAAPKCYHFFQTEETWSNSKITLNLKTPAG